MPAGKFNDGSIKVAMLTYSLSQLMTRQIDFNWNKGIYREMVRRAVKKVRYQGMYFTSYTPLHTVNFNK